MAPKKMTAPHWDRLEGLRAEHRQRTVEHRQLETQAEAAKTAPHETSEALAKAFARDDSAAVKRLERELDQARSRAAEAWPERVRGAQLKAQGAAGAISTYAATNLHALMAEQEGLADQLHARQVAALQTVVDVERERAQFVQKLTEIERAAGRPPSIPDRPMPLYRDARQALEAGVPRIHWPHGSLATNQPVALPQEAKSGDDDPMPLVTEVNF